MTSIRFLASAADFLEVAGAHLAKEPVLSTVVATVAERAGTDQAGLEPDPRDWYAVTCGPAGEVTGVAMRTAPFHPRPVYLLPMPQEAAVELARALHGRGEQVVAANGALTAASAFLDELGRMTGRVTTVAQHTRLFELRELKAPESSPPGELRRARPDEAELCLAWFEAFARDADEQAGREPGTHHDLGEDLVSIRRRIDRGRLWLWEDRGEVVHLTGANPPAFGVARVGPVYTPAAYRGRGYASAAVCEVTRAILAAGARPCLFTDQANPTSNAIYERLGYQRVVDMGNLVLDAEGPGARA